MKISIGSRIVKGPWGGGNLFIINLSNYLTSQGHEVYFDLSQKDIDLILLTDPRINESPSSSFDHIDIEFYLNYVNPNSVVVQRINECDERKNTTGLNNFYIEASNVADNIVFVSNWLKNLYVEQGINEAKSGVILSGSDKSIFNSAFNSKWNKKEKLRLITHHWSANTNKGYETYKKIDNMLDNPKWKNLIEFTYVGNISDEFQFKNTKVIKPKSGKELSIILQKSHVYVTGSINEPSGNHHIEAAQCGLPILFLKSGGLVEYCEGFGVAFDNENFEIKLEEMIKDYDNLYNKMAEYELDSDKMSQEYLDLFQHLISVKIDSSKKFKRNFKGYLFNIIQKFKTLKYTVKVNLKIIIKSLYVSK